MNKILIEFKHDVSSQSIFNFIEPKFLKDLQ